MQFQRTQKAAPLNCGVMPKQPIMIKELDFMKKMKWFFVTAAIVFLSSCATTSNWVDPGHYVDFKAEVIKKPEIGSTSEVSIGESIISTFRKQIVPTLVLINDVIYDGKYRGFTNTFRIKKGFLKLTRQNPEGRFFTSEEGITIEAVGPTQYLDGGIFLYNDKPNSAAIFLIQKDTGYFRIQPINDSNFEVIENKDYWSKDSFNRELVYTGKSGDTISILYREFIDDMARPAFSQEIKYDLTDTKIIGYKSARFEIIDADNLSIHYKTLKHLE